MASHSLIFVRDTDQGTRFLNRQGGWIASFDEAAMFASTWEAIDFCKKNRIHNAEIVMRIGDPLYDVRIDAR